MRHPRHSNVEENKYVYIFCGNGVDRKHALTWPELEAACVTTVLHATEKGFVVQEMTSTAISLLLT